MADTNFVQHQTVIQAAWLNDVNDYIYDTNRIVAIDEPQFGAVSGTDCSLIINTADAVLNALGGGTLLFPAGEWQYSSNITRSNNVTWKGVSSLGSKLKCMNGTAQLFHTGARGGLEDLYIEGPYTTQATRIAAASTSIGVVDNGATTYVKNVRVKYFKKGWSKTIGYWCEYTKLWLEENGTGWGWDNTGSDFCNLISFYSCTFRQNDRNGIASTASTNNTSINYFGCDVENNCGESPTTYPQIALFNARNVNWIGGYCEAGAISPAPDLWNFQNTSLVTVNGMYLGGARKAFFSGSNGSGTIEIKNIYFAGGTAVITTSAYEFPSCSNITVYDFNTHTATIQLDGTGSQLISKKIAQQESISWTPVISGSSVAGTPTYSIQVGTATRIGNKLFYSCRVGITATGGATGNVRISLPLTASSTAGLIFTGTVETSGVTPTAGKTYFTGRVLVGTNYIELMEGGNAGGALQVLWTGVAAASTVIVTGFYDIAT